ncbi:MAG: CHRD domain-containing protein [Ramlibacter sp.]|nr:CHRD domain-containing protein [Ramlibacter sp.]MBX3659380.1 CHRD domain-containing protein [Ramlibacter sp.]MCW5650741.1 CHRD domain-containing protein [Ramlibacter sp.]
MKRQTLLRSALAAGVVALVTTGCGSMRPSQKIDIYEARLSGAQEVPANTSTGTGQAELKWNRSSNVLDWKVTYTGLSGEVTGAHIHGPAAPGQNAGVVIPFMTGLSGTITGQTNLTTAQAADLASGRWYVNVHTSAFPGGEIRGQLTERK